MNKESFSSLCSADWLHIRMRSTITASQAPCSNHADSPDSHQVRGLSTIDISWNT
jgi:hypothetical protein